MPESEPTAGNGTAVVQYDPRTELVSALDKVNNRAERFRSNLVGTTPDEIGTLVKLLGTSDAKLRSLDNKQYVITDWLVHVTDDVDTETGEVGERLRIALHTDDGKVITGGSMIVIQRFLQMQALIAKLPNVWHVAVVFEHGPSRDGKGEWTAIKSAKLVLPSVKKAK